MSILRKILLAAPLMALVAGTALGQRPPCVAAGHHVLESGPCGKSVASPQSSTWVLTGSMNAARDFHTATLLADGRVLVAGGRDANGILDSAELYDPATRAWSLTGRMNTPRLDYTATLLFDGRVLVAGGTTVTGAGPFGFGATDTAELYDPATGTWRTTGSLRTKRGGQAATRLHDGRVLVAGGSNDDGTRASAELYDPATGTWRETGSLNLARWGHTLTLLHTGEVLVARGGGDDDIVNPAFGDAELYDPTSGTWRFTAPSGSNTVWHTATLLHDGKVLVTGGDERRAGGGGELAVSELFDPLTGTWSRAGDLAVPRAFHTATLLATGGVVIAGGEGYPRQLPNPDQAIRKTSELFDPAHATWTSAGALNMARYGHTATALANGSVLVAGGFTGTLGTGLSSAEILEYELTPAVVEYRNTHDFAGSPGGHYFYTDDPAELTFLDAGNFGQFTRTGRTFNAGGSKQVCRFFGSASPGPNAHFYTISDDECAALKALQVFPTPRDVQQWNYEGLRFAAEPARIDAAGVSCPTGTLPVYRGYNNAYPLTGPRNTWDSMHRYSTNRADIEQMVTQFGWRDEGIAFCSPQ
jgi:N-acetylneuraminic acid mutarotase